MVLAEVLPAALMTHVCTICPDRTEVPAYLLLVTRFVEGAMLDLVAAGRYRSDCLSSGMTCPAARTYQSVVTATGGDLTAHWPVSVSVVSLLHGQLTSYTLGQGRSLKLVG